jgi:peptide subunit release factor 1 (eRF1)
MTAITRTELKPLLALSAGNEMVISCYADLSVAEGFRPNWEGPFQGKYRTLRKMISEESPLRHELNANRCALEKAMHSQPKGTRWVAVFSVAKRGFLQTFALDVPVETDLVLDSSPYLAPLLAAKQRRKVYMAIHLDTHRARIYLATPANVRLHDELDAEVPKHQHSSGERYGYEQKNIDRHRDDRMLHFHKELNHQMQAVLEQQPIAGLLLFGTHEILEEFKAQLPSPFSKLVLREQAGPWYEKPAEFEGHILEAVTELFTEQEAVVVSDFWNLLQQKQVVTGPTAVLEALQSGQLGQQGHGYLVLGPDPRETVGKCTGCHALNIETGAACSKCQAPCHIGNLWEEVLLMAARHGIVVRFVADAKKFAPYDGMVAVLPHYEFAPRSFLS